ncbi:pilus assembly protein PilM [Candidatus Roizmanbacteria bacterium]|nr:pilus assembly protein PilM [Candidatus Roizmanbacteria bacterium]
MSDIQTCIDIGEYFLRIGQGTQANNKIEMISMGMLSDTPLFYEYANEKTLGDEADAIRKLMNALNITKRNVRLIIPDTFTYSQIITMPRLKEKELLSAIRYQADQFIPLPIEETSLDLEILHEDKANNSLLVLIVAAPLNIISRVEALCEAAGLIPSSIENELSSTARMLSQFYRPEPKEGGTIFVNFSYSTSSLYFFDHIRGLTVDAHNFKMGYNLFLKETQINTMFDMAKSRGVLKRIGFSSSGTINLAELLKPSKNVFAQEIEKFTLSVREKFKMAVSSVQLINLATEINAFDKAVAQQLSIPTYNFNVAPFIVPNKVVSTYSKELSSFVTVVGGCID